MVNLRWLFVICLTLLSSSFPLSIAQSQEKSSMGIAILDLASGQRGVFVQNVRPGGPAFQAGIQAEDIITHVNNQESENTSGLFQILGETRPGMVIPIILIRGGIKKTLSVKLGAFSDLTKQIRKDAEVGNADAQHALGKMYMNGNGVPKNEKLAVEWLRKSANQGNPNARAILNNMGQTSGYFQQGNLVKECDSLAADGNDLETRGVWVTFENLDANAAINVCGKAVKQNPNLPRLKFQYGRAFFKLQRFPEAVQWFHEAARQGHREAQTFLGIMFFNGQGVNKDDRVAMQWYRSAAEQGSSVAQYYLGTMYWYGEGVPRNEQVAVEWLSKSAGQGDIQAQNLLGEMGKSYQPGRNDDNQRRAMNNPQTRKEASRQTPDKTKKDPVSNKEKYLLLKVFKVIDQQGFETPVEIFRFLAPADWKMSGGVEWIRDPGNCYNNPVSINIRATSPDGLTGFEVFPDFLMEWTYNPRDQSYMLTPGCPVGPPINASEFVERKLIPQFRRGARIQEKQPNPAFVKAISEEMNTALNQSNLPMKYQADSTKVRLKYLKGNNSVEEWMFANILTTDLKLSSSQAMVFESRNELVSIYRNNGMYISGFWAPEGRLEENERLMNTIYGSIKRNLAWNKAVINFQNAIVAGNMKTMREMDKIWKETNEQISNINADTWKKRQESNDRIFKANIMGIREVGEYSDPISGTNIELPQTDDDYYRLQNSTEEIYLQVYPGGTPPNNGDYVKLKRIDPFNR